MKCQKCSKPAVIHLTEIITDPIGAKRTVEMHLCLGHAAEAGLIAPGSELLPQVLSAQSDPHPSKKNQSTNPASADTGLPTAIIPNPNSPAGLTVTRARLHPPNPPAVPSAASRGPLSNSRASWAAPTTTPSTNPNSCHCSSAPGRRDRPCRQNSPAKKDPRNRPPGEHAAHPTRVAKSHRRRELRTSRPPPR